MKDIRQFIPANEIITFTPALRINNHLYLSGLCVTKETIELETPYGWYQLASYPVTVNEIAVKNFGGRTVRTCKVAPITLHPSEILPVLAKHFEPKGLPSFDRRLFPAF